MHFFELEEIFSKKKLEPRPWVIKQILDFSIKYEVRKDILKN